MALSGAALHSDRVTGKLQIHMSSWAAGNIAVEVNSTRTLNGTPDTQAVADRARRAGDNITCLLPDEHATQREPAAPVRCNCPRE